MSEECPCRYCVPPKRTAYCHTDCPEYKEWCIKHDEKNALINSKKNEEAEVCKYIAYRMSKQRKLKER